MGLVEDLLDHGSTVLRSHRDVFMSIELVRWLIYKENLEHKQHCEQEGSSIPPALNRLTEVEEHARMPAGGTTVDAVLSKSILAHDH